MDTNDLHGSIHQAMAEAVENAYIVLFCINEHYYESEFCTKGTSFRNLLFPSLITNYIIEALYTDKKHINFIPCRLQSTYDPRGWLGIVIRDQLYIDFSAPNNFDMAFEELIAEIQAIESRVSVSPSKSNFELKYLKYSKSQSFHFHSVHLKFDYTFVCVLLVQTGDFLPRDNTQRNRGDEHFADGCTYQ